MGRQVELGAGAVDAVADAAVATRQDPVVVVDYLEGGAIVEADADKASDADESSSPS